MPNAILLIDKAINDYLLLELELLFPFVEDPLPGEIYGIYSVNSWTRETNVNVGIEGQLWVTAAYSSYPEANRGELAVLSKLDRIIPCIAAHIDIDELSEIRWDGRITSTMRAPLKTPNSDRNEIWIVDFLASVNLKISQKNDAWASAS